MKSDRLDSGCPELELKGQCFCKDEDWTTVIDDMGWIATVLGRCVHGNGEG